MSVAVPADAAATGISLAPSAAVVPLLRAAVVAVAAAPAEEVEPLAAEVEPAVAAAVFESAASAAVVEPAATAAVAEPAAAAVVVELAATELEPAVVVVSPTVTHVAPDGARAAGSRPNEMQNWHGEVNRNPVGRRTA